ncbi:MAG: flagellar biosynthetic protein FliR [Lachnospiraceae bacterium]|nr:flagellar biosynthetic protein FliR [Lachnospiraceae bacterium]
MANFTVENLEFLLAILVRISAFLIVAPVFSLRDFPVRGKLLLSAAVAIVVYFVTPYEPLVYGGVIGYAVLIIKEAVVGLILGLFANLAYYILSLAGQLIDMEVGLSNTQELDPQSQVSVTISSTILNYSVIMTLIVTNMHLFILKAVIDSFTAIPVGGLVLKETIFQQYLAYMGSYMILAFRIVLPEFAAMLVVNTILAILAKAAPQLNMFVIGFQLKIFVGITVLVIMLLLLPGISDMIFENMIENMRNAIYFMREGS